MTAVEHWSPLEGQPPRFVSTCRVQFCDTDMAGIVHFANFYRFMEKVESEFFRSINLSLVTRKDNGEVVGWPRVKSSCSFKAPAYFEDELEGRLYIERVGVKSLTMVQEFWRDETLIARGRLKTAFCLFPPDRPMQAIVIPDEYRELFEATPA